MCTAYGTCICGETVTDKSKKAGLGGPWPLPILVM